MVTTVPIFIVSDMQLNSETNVARTSVKLLLRSRLTFAKVSKTGSLNLPFSMSSRVSIS